MKLPYDIYTTGTYFKNNPTWDSEDSIWKARWVKKILEAHKIRPKSVCEVGCGSGGVLAKLREYYPDSSLNGFDIAPDAAYFWKSYEKENIRFNLGDYIKLNKSRYDILLLLDVIEHIPNPFEFLLEVRYTASFYIFHFPLDLSAINILREKPLLNARKNVGHIQYFTKNLALSLLEECGYNVIKIQYSAASLVGPKCTWKTRLASVPRILIKSFNKDWGVRALGGETLFVLARDGIQKNE